MALWGTTEYIDENALQVNLTRLKKTMSALEMKQRIVALRSFQVIPLEILNRFTGDKKVAGTLGKLREIYQIIIWLLMINVDGGFASHETDIIKPYFLFLTV